jgi:hypothetical protein
MKLAFALITFLSVTLLAFPGFAQSPPTATEAFNLRIKCKKMSDEKAEELSWHEMSVEVGATLGWSPARVAAQNNWARPEVVASWSTSKYDPINNRCYGRIYSHLKNEKLKKEEKYDNEEDAVYDLQTDDMLAFASIKNGKKSGIIFDPDPKRRNPRPDACRGGCPANIDDLMWQDTEDYMDEIMADPRKQ